jgi:hypothetical protein
VLDAGGNSATQFLVQGGVIAASLMLGGISWRHFARLLKRPGGALLPAQYHRKPMKSLRD